MLIAKSAIGTYCFVTLFYSFQMSIAYQRLQRLLVSNAVRDLL